MRFQISGKQRKREMQIPWKEAQEGLPVPLTEDQYQERFWRRRLDGIGLDTHPYSPQRGERAHAHTHTYTHTQTHTHTHRYMPREMHELRKSRVQPPGDSRWKGAQFRPPTG
jgi:hypothetical protein